VAMSGVEFWIVVFRSMTLNATLRVTTDEVQASKEQVSYSYVEGKANAKELG